MFRIFHFRQINSPNVAYFATFLSEKRQISTYISYKILIFIIHVQFSFIDLLSRKNTCFSPSAKEKKQKNTINEKIFSRYFHCLPKFYYLCTLIKSLFTPNSINRKQHSYIIDIRLWRRKQIAKHTARYILQ